MQREPLIEKQPATEGTSSSMIALAHFALILCQFSFSGWHIVSKVALNDGADPLVFAVYKQVASTVLMLLLVLVKGIKIHVARSDLLQFFGLGIGIFMNVVGTIFALNYISATRYALFQPTIPCIAALISVLVGIERLTLVKTIGILLAVGGAFAIVAWPKSSGDGGESGDTEKNVTVGILLTAAQCTAMAAVIVFQKPLLARYDPSLVTFTYYGFGTCVTVLLTACVAFRFTVQSFIFHGDLSPWLALVYTCLFSSLYAYNAYAWAGKRLLPSVTTLYCTLQPPATALLSWLIFKQIISLPEIVGGALVILGLLVTVIFEDVSGASFGPSPDSADKLNDTQERDSYHLLVNQENADDAVVA
jgi:drug/metabolite transporter (DMT)-like permease